MTQIEKQLFENQDGGYVGAVVIGPDGKDKGVAVEPGGYVLLSEAEQRLTANAPRRAQDNPFVEQTRIVTDPETGVMSEVKVTPLVPVEDSRYVPSVERPIGAPLEGARATATAQHTSTSPELPVDPVTVTNERDPVGEAERRVLDTSDADLRPGARVQAPSRAVAAAAAAAPVADPLAGGEATTPAAQGLQPPVTDDADPVGQEAGRNPFAAPSTPEESPVSVEEHAAAVDPAIGEETGAAAPPQGEQPEGHYQAMEEVGTPDAPQPPPFVPEDTQQ